jgi:hypothetical protein
LISLIANTSSLGIIGFLSKAYERYGKFAVLFVLLLGLFIQIACPDNNLYIGFVLLKFGGKLT